MSKRIIILIGILFFVFASSLYAEKVPESPFAINGMGYFHFKNDPAKWDIGEQRAKVIDDLGSSFDRSDFWWGYIEPEKGKFDWSFPDAVVADYKKRGFRIFPILNYFSAWSGNKAPHTDAERELFGRYVFMVVSRYKKDVRYWEVWNEPNLGQFWAPVPNPEDYAKLLQVTYKAAKAADPTCTIVAPALAGADFNFLKEMYKYGAKGNYDALSYHYYRTDSPEKFPEVAREIKQIHDFLEKHGDPKPIWVTEMGVQSYEGAGGVTEEEQARLVVRNYMELLATGEVQRIFWFCLMDWTDDPKSPPWDAHLGLTRRNLTPKRSFYSYKTMVQKLTGKKFIGEIKTAKGIYQYLFADTSTNILVCWTTNTTPQEIKIRLTHPSSKVTRLDGTIEDIVQKDNSLVISVNQDPIYIENIQPVEVQRANIRFEPWFLEIPKGIPTSATIAITNILDTTLTGNLQFRCPAGWSIEPASLAYSLSTGSTMRYPIKIRSNDLAKKGSFIIQAFDTTNNQGLWIEQRKEVWISDPYEISYQLPSNLWNKKDKFVNILMKNNTERILEGNLRLNMSYAFSSKPIAKHFSLAPSDSFQKIPFEIQKYEIPKTFNGRFAVTYTVNGELLTDGKSLPILESKDFVYFPIHKLNKPMKIDGDLSKWKGIQPIMDPDSELIVKLDPQGFKGRADLSATIYLAWDEKNLYVAADVNDDLQVPPPNDTFWDYDSLQLAFDTKNDAFKGDGGFGNDDYELEMAYRENDRDLYAGVIPMNNKLDAFKTIKHVIMKKKDGKGYIYELAIPREMFPELILKEGSSFGFCGLVNDNDGQGRKGWVETTPGIGFGKDPKEYIRVILTK